MTPSQNLVTAFVLALATFIALPQAVAQFETRQIVPVGPFTPVGIAVGDFNHDGKLDLAVAGGNNNTEQLTILLGRGDGTFQPSVNYSVTNALYSIATADFNRDGNLDLVTADYLNSQVSVLMGNGDGTFQPPVTYPVPVGPRQVLVGDFNGDHWPDIIALENYVSCNCVSVLLNNKNGTFAAAKNTTTPYPYGLAMVTGDFNRDGKTDVAITGFNGGSSTLLIMPGKGDGTFTIGASYYGEYSEFLTAADLRGNGLLDLIVANEATPTDVYVFLGNGDGTFGSPVGYFASFPAWLATADFNGDGHLDLVVVDRDTNSGSVSVLLGNGDGTFQKVTTLPVGYEPVYVAIGDFNGDKKADLAIPDYHFDDVYVLLNTGVVSFSPTTPLNFKKVKVGTTSAPLTVTLTNTGKSALTISSMKTTGQFATTSTCGSSVAAGANCSISVTFSPTSIGLKSGTVTINDSASSKPMVIELSGTGD